ncbi:MAG: zinc ribbon domain-containing protein [Candidatus Micrarchaeota archaeon]|nr:zinc ribbon domain-containing protein [Candidatus Micrarchaeota archaeon]
MGIGELLSNMAKGLFGSNPHANRKAKCPKCASELTLGMERCPKCGTHVESMFRIECPKCKEQNELKAEKCKNCGFSFVRQPTTGRVQYRCPICGYVADYYMLSCPSCGVKFIS